VIPLPPGAFQPPHAGLASSFVEKATYSAQDNPNFDAIWQALGARRVVVVRVASDTACCYAWL